MRNGKWVLGLAIALLFCGTAFSQAAPDDYNRLCIHNGGDYYINVAFGPATTGNPNSGSGKYYPSYNHIVSTPDVPGGVYLWKIRGWTWVGMKGPLGTSIWAWTGMLLATESNDYNYNAVPSVNLSCTFPAPHAWASGALLTAGGGGWSNPVFQYGPNGMPSGFPLINGKNYLLPSTSAFSSGANIFALVGGTLNTGTISPYYGYGFGVTYATFAIGITSTTSIYQYIFEDQGVADAHYLIISGNEMDHNAGYPYAVGDLPGYKGKNQMMIYRPPYQIGWPVGLSTGQNSGNSYAMDMCLLVDDSVLIPANIGAGHPTLNPGNPFAALGFDVGTATMTPEVGGGGAMLGFTTEDYKASGQAFAILASKHTPGSELIGALNYDGGTHRYPCGGLDGVTNYFLARLTLWLHALAYPYPVCAWGNNNAIGGASAQFNIGAKFQATLPGKEYIFCGFPTNGVSNDCTSAHMVTWR